MYRPGQQLDPVKSVRRLVSYVFTLLLVLVLGSDGLLLWQQGWALLEHLLRLLHLMFADSLQAITE
jgi:hypothetical protein